MRKEIFNREMISAKEDKLDIDFDALRRELRDFRAREVLPKDDINLVLQFLNDQDREVYWEASGRLNELKEEIGILTKTDKKKEQAWVAEHSVLYQTYKSILERAVKETKYFQELCQAGLFPEFLNHFTQSEQGEIGHVKVKWGSTKLYQDRYKKTGGMYLESGFSRTIHIKDTPPSQTRILYELAYSGDMPGPASTFFHEWIHSFQNCSVWERLLLYEPFAGSKIELEEAQANRSDLCQNSDLPKRQFVELLMELKNDDNSPFYDLDVDHIIMAVTAIDQMRALSFSPWQIGKLIRKCDDSEWNGRYFISIQRAIDQKCQELSIDEDDLENLVHADKMKREIERLKVKMIAQEELKQIQDNYINHKDRENYKLVPLVKTTNVDNLDIIESGK